MERVLPPRVRRAGVCQQRSHRLRPMAASLRARRSDRLLEGKGVRVDRDLPTNISTAGDTQIHWSRRALSIEPRTGFAASPRLSQQLETSDLRRWRRLCSTHGKGRRIVRKNRLGFGRGKRGNADFATDGRTVEGMGETSRRPSRPTRPPPGRMGIYSGHAHVRESGLGTARGRS